MWFSPIWPGAPRFCLARRDSVVIIVIAQKPAVNNCENVRNAQNTGTVDRNVSLYPNSVHARPMADSSIQGQTAQWNLHHRRICKRFHVYTSSPAFRGLDEYYRTDSVLLSHVMALSPSPASEENMASIRDLDSLSKLPPYRIFMDLLPSGNALTLHVATESDVSSTEVYSRFKNNNFVVHSHLNPGFAHGIFPIASRFLNHSCTPNAAPRFVLSPFNPPRMEIVALRQLASGEEVRDIHI
jgi:hypothetical protein